MDKRNSESSAAVKAAAWAWYQHGSGGKSPTETEFAATTRTFRGAHGNGPSRFKRQLVMISCEDLDVDKKRVTESMAAAGPSSNPSSNTVLVGHGPHGSHVHKHSSDLFDAYEIKTISNQLDLLTRSSSNSNNMAGIRPRVVLSSPRPSGRGSELQRKKKYETKLLGLKIRHGVICGGSRNDVVEPTPFNRGSLLRSENHQDFVSRTSTAPRNNNK